MTEQTALSPETSVAVMMAVPSPMAVTSPDPLTVATVGSELIHSYSVPPETLMVPLWPTASCSVLSISRLDAGAVPSPPGRTPPGVMVSTVSTGVSSGLRRRASLSPRKCHTSRATIRMAIRITTGPTMLGARRRVSLRRPFLGPVYRAPLRKCSSSSQKGQLR